MLNFIIILATFAVADDPAVDAPRFARLMAGLHGEIRDVSFIYEGSLKYIGPASLLEKGQRPEDQDLSFQGRYSYRADGSAALDYYSTRSKFHGVQMRTKLIDYKGKLVSMMMSPRHRAYARARSKARQTRSDGNSLVDTGSPERIFTQNFFQDYNRVGYSGFECPGWDEVEGHRCLRVAFAISPDSDVTFRFWIDMERGGNPLKIETYFGKNLWGRVDQVHLAQVRAEDGKEVWLPVAGRSQSFVWEGKSLSSPTYTEEYSVVPTSIRVNQGLSDKHFSIDVDDATGESEAMKRLRREIESVPPVRSDPAGVQERLDKQLAAADEQAQRLEASRGPRTWTRPLQAGLIAVGGVVLAAVFLVRWRSR